MSTRVVPGITDVPGGAWDRLVGPDGFYTTHRWLHGLHHAFGPDRVLVAEDRDGGLLGGLPTWPGEHDGSGLFDLPGVLPAATADWLWLGARRATRNELVGRARPVLRALLDHALALAREEGRAGLVMPYLPTRHALLLAAAHPRAQALLHSADAVLPIPPGGLEAHLAALPRRDRGRRRWEERAARDAGVEVDWRPFTPDLEADAVRLITQNRSRHGGTADEGWMRRVFAGQRAAGLLADAHACVATRDGRPRAILVCYGRGDRLHARYFGFDYARSRPAGEYFLLWHQVPLRHAAEAGFRRCHLGVSAWRGKVRRGAVLSPLAAVVLPLDGLTRTARRAAEHNAGAVRAWRALAPGRPGAYSPEWDLWGR
ncbi:GNAT family N-acetyltransferase [Saccharothrix syringae]|uniref:GNAT family N-acetyltransferase n=1 Tax=Saccharothrix syringae TaxID=103733 RepID=A0A5Q0H0E3_SACSY|nr:GNAT family N-acetyltransferase [Saccharothrix syringae]QFZ19707.1 GNAT family N-acetyltransferase [Saccharothrix syringae]